MSEFLSDKPLVGFTEFDSVSAKQWKQKIQFDLKGADYNETLVWQSPEGINVRPFYHKDDFPNGFEPIPGQPSSWKIGQEIFIDDEAIANKIAIDAIERGAEAIQFKATKEFDFEIVFKNFPFEKAPIYFEFRFLSKEFLNKLIHFFNNKNATVYYNLDIIGNVAQSGNWFQNINNDYLILGEILHFAPSQNILGVDVAHYQNAGATIVQQLAYALAHATEYLDYSEKNIKPKVKGNDDNYFNINGLKISFKLAIGSNYFFEIAKIRALRKLYAAVAREYGAKETCHILSVPSNRNKTLYDYNVNMLRTTTECMAAVLGGADMVCNSAYDSIYHKSNEFGQRIARNQLLILKNESYFEKVANPSDGAYYIESLTNELAYKALEIFKEIEKGGGFLKQLKAGTIQKKIKESAEKEQHLFDAGKLKLLGSNLHPNKNDHIKDEVELFPFVKHNPIKTLIAPIIAKRLSEAMEQERLKNEK